MGLFSTAELNSIHRILIVKPSSHGDIIHAFPALEILSRYFVQAEFDFLVNPSFAGILDFAPVPIRKRILFERKKLGSLSSTLPETLRLIKAIRSENYDLVIDFQGLLRSAFFAGAANAKYGCVGFAAPREKASTLFYRHKITVNALHAVERNVELANLLCGSDFTTPVCSIPQREYNKAVLDTLPEKFVLMLPGARWESKRFPELLFADIARILSKNGIASVLAGSRDEIPHCEKIVSAVKEDPNIISLAGKTTLADLFELTRRASAVVCNDSGPLHIASILNKEIFAFFGATKSQKTGPWNKNAHIYRLDIPCSGCLKRNCPLDDILCHKLDANKIAGDIINMENQQ